MSETAVEIPAETEVDPQEEFNARVARLMEITEDPEMARKMMCEIYIFISGFDQQLREFKQFAESNPMMGNMLARMLGFGKGKD